MAKKKAIELNEVVEIQPQIIKPELVKISFTKDFSGQLNNWKVKAKKGDSLEVLPYQAEWIKQFEVID